jgi:integrase
MQRVTLPRVLKKETAALEQSQLEWFFAATAGHLWLELLLALKAATGCRRGELLALTWTDVEYEIPPASITISKSLAQTRAKGIFLKAPKGRKTRRFLLPPSAVQALQKHRAQQNEIRAQVGPAYRTDLNLIFATEEGEYLKPGSVSAKVSLLARRLGFPKGISLHTLRHTHGSQLLSAGVPLPAVSKRLGHANTHITATVYAHALERDDELAAQAWEQLMGEAMQRKDHKPN